MGVLALTGGPRSADIEWPAWPVPTSAVEKAALEVLRSGRWWAHSQGEATGWADREEEPPSRVGRFQRAFARRHGASYGIAATNGTATLEIALRALAVGPGDEVIVPAYTFVATATAVLMVGAKPVFVDVDAGTLNLDTSRLEDAITDRTRAIIPVHFAGQPSAMEAILVIAGRHGVRVIEDAAQAHLAAYRGQPVGSLGDMASFSFQGSKNLTAGEGGAITTNDRDLAVTAESIVWGGRRADEGWYAHYRLGSNFRMTELQAAILAAQLPDAEDQLGVRAANAAALDRRLAEIDGVQPGERAPDTTSHAYHLYVLRYESGAFGGASKATFVDALRAEGVVGASAGYSWPLYRNPVFGLADDEVAESAARCPNAERACSAEAVWLPQSMLLAADGQIERVADAIAKIRQHADELPRLGGVDGGG